MIGAPSSAHRHLLFSPSPKFNWGAQPLFGAVPSYSPPALIERCCVLRLFVYQVLSPKSPPGSGQNSPRLFSCRPFLVQVLSKPTDIVFERVDPEELIAPLIPVSSGVVADLFCLPPPPPLLFNKAGLSWPPTAKQKPFWPPGVLTAFTNLALYKRLNETAGRVRDPWASGASPPFTFF